MPNAKIAVIEDEKMIASSIAARLRSEGFEVEIGGGSGLGLPIARWLVDLHGGSIRVDCGYRDGCRMLVTLPPA